MRSLSSGNRISSSRKKKGISTVVGALIVFGMVLTVMYGYFYFVNQDEQLYLQSALQDNYNSNQQVRENLIITGMLMGAAVGFSVNNTGISTTITAYFVMDSSTGKILQYNTGKLSTPALPLGITQGHSTTVNTGVLYVSGKTYTIKVLTSRGYTAVGTYPPKKPTPNIIGSLVAAGMGSLSMIFSSYNYYSYNRTNPYIINVNHPHSGPYLPYGTYVVLSVQITNNDPGLGTVVIGSHTNLWTYQQCISGCGSAPVLSFFAINVASNGTITSTAKGSFTKIVIPYGSTQTIYFGSAYDLSLNSFQQMEILGNAQRVGKGEYAVFLIVSGSWIGATNATGYSQNLPYSSSYVTDNIAWFTETPTTCNPSTPTSLSLVVNNSEFSTGSVTSVSINASSFSSLQSSSLRLPQYWGVTISNGIITWSAKNNGGYIGAPGSITLAWNGTAPSTVGAQVVLPVTVTYSSGTANQHYAVGCYIT